MTNRYKELLKEYRKLAKRADQRLVRLESYSKQKGYKGILQFAYKKAQRDIRSWSGENATRFNTKPPSNTNSLKAKIKDIKTFLESATSTLAKTKESKGIQNIYQNRVDTINNKYGTNFTWQQMAKFFDSGLNKKLDRILDSETKLQVIGIIQQNETEIKDAIKENEKAHIDVEGDAVLENEVNKILKKYKLNTLKVLF